jgi:MFS family permease
MSGDSVVSIKLGSELRRETLSPGFLVIYAKLSDILGTKLLILFAVTLFAVFSIACGVCNTMLQLYVSCLFPLDSNHAC